jgi:hypothetical protein
MAINATRSANDVILVMPAENLFALNYRRFWKKVFIN